MSTFDFDNGGHHKPRKIDKKKHRKRGFSEDSRDNRQSRINFKRYVRELEEDLLDDELDDYED